MMEEELTQVAPTSVTPVDVGTSRLTLRVEYLESPIEVGRLQAQFHKIEILHPDPLMLRMVDGGHAVVLDFGAVVYWSCSEQACERLRQHVTTVTGHLLPMTDAEDTLQVRLGMKEDRVNFKEVWLQHLSLEHMRIISQALGRSAALKHCERAVARALANASPVVDDLKARGSLTQAGRDILKTIGFTLDIRETMLSKLAVLDDPPEAWSSERLSRLHALLQEHFDFRNRVGTLQAKLDFLADLTQSLTNLLQHRESHRLEWIVVALIVVEVLLALFEAFGRAH
jgi:uncharacterized Rmd1/YagE family protein